MKCSPVLLFLFIKVLEWLHLIYVISHLNQNLYFTNYNIVIKNPLLTALTLLSYSRDRQWRCRKKSLNAKKKISQCLFSCIYIEVQTRCFVCCVWCVFYLFNAYTLQTFRKTRIEYNEFGVQLKKIACF